MIEINVAEDYKILCKILISLSCGVALLLVPWILLMGICKLYSKIKDNEHINCCNFIVVIIFVTVTTVLGYITAFKLCDLKEKFIEKKSVNNLILLIIAFLSGIAMWVLLYLIIQIHKLLYKCCNMICGNECTKCCCNPSIMLPIILLLLLGTYLGSLIIEGTGVTLNVDKKYKDIVKYVLSFLIGNGIYLSPVILISLCNKCICKRRTETQNITGEELL